MDTSKYKDIFHCRIRQYFVVTPDRPAAINYRFHRMWLTLSEKCPSIQLPWNTSTELIPWVKKNLGKSTKINIVPVFLSSNLMMHSSPLLTTLSAPSHAHLLMFHSSALDFITSVIYNDESHGTKYVSQLIPSREGTGPIMNEQLRWSLNKEATKNRWDATTLS